MTLLGHGAVPLDDIWADFAAFGTDWLYLLVPGALMLAAAGALAVRAGDQRGLVHRFAHGASAVSGLPAWTAGPLAILFGGALTTALVGFFWDVAWHIDIGRDEFLFSPPHVALLVGLGLIGVAGLVGVLVATRDRAEVGWRVGRWRVPIGAAGLLVAGAAAMVGFGVDELWHQAYGLDVTMWSPPHLTMISAAVFASLSAWVLHAEAGPEVGRPALRRAIAVLFAATGLTALSAWQLEFDLGVPAWQQLYQPVLIAVAAGFALTVARTALGRGGALAAVAGFLVLRGITYALTAGAWSLSEPRFPLYLAAAIAVELAVATTERRGAPATAAAAGLGVATLGLAGAWGWTHVWSWHPWQPELLPMLAVAAPLGAVGAALLGVGFGRVVTFRPSGLRAPHVAAGFGLVAIALAIPFPRNVPEAEAIVRSTPAGEGRVDVEVEVNPSDLADGASRWEVMAWQGQGHVNVPLVETTPGRYVTASPVPVGGDWKTVVRLATHDRLGGVPVYLPDDPAIGASEVPVVPVRRQAFVGDQAYLLREAHDGPAWPGVVAYASVFTGIGAILGLIVAGAAGLERRRRALGWGEPPGPLAGHRVVLTGAAGGIGAATRRALEAQGARVIGLDLVADRPDTLAVDVTDPHAVRDAVDEAAHRLGGLDVVVANAGIGDADDSTAMPSARAREVLDVNLLGAWHTIAAALDHLADGGVVVGVTSGLATATVPYAAAYTASKRALSGYLDVLRLELEGRVHVVEIQPAYIRTAIHDGPARDGASLDGLVRVERVEDAAGAIVTAIEAPRSRLGSSPLTTLELTVARRAPRLVRRLVRRRLLAVERDRGRPRFVRDRGAQPAGRVARKG